jgi:hypothetical protein
VVIPARTPERGAVVAKGPGDRACAGADRGRDVIGHLVLYEFRSDVPPEGRERLAAALEHALTSVPTVRAARLGRRTSVGAGYESKMPDGFSYFALLEFEDTDGLRVYLEHPAHAGLGALFWELSARTLVLDYELASGELGAALQAFASR